MNKPTRIEAGHYEYKGYTIERRENGEWYFGPAGEFASDVADTLSEAVQVINNMEETPMTYEQHKANQEADAAAWMEANSHELDAVIEVGQDVGNAMHNPRPKSDARLLRDDVTNTVRERAMVKDTEKARKGSQEPTDCLANSMGDPDLLGLYACGPGEAKAANKARAYHGIEYVLDGAGRVRGGQSGKTRETKAEKRARLAARFPKA